MKYRLLDILACPMCKNFPLELRVFEEKTYDRRIEGLEKPYCELYCGLNKEYIKNLSETPSCDECIKREVVAGILYCRKCGRWYPIIDEIPRMLPDNLRRENEDKKFLEKYKDQIPVDILEKGKPFSLK